MSRRLPNAGRGARSNPPNRFERFHVERESWVDASDPSVRTRFFEDHTRNVISTNRSPDVPFDAGINPYRGCEHGCAYCFARPTHEFLGFSAGLDFESKIVVKKHAAELLRTRLGSSRWTPQPLMLSGNTDPYQPVERRLRITRGVLEVLADFRNPVAVITKNALVARDVDLLSELAAHDAVQVLISVTTLQRELQRTLEPRTSTPTKRLWAIERLAAHGIPVGVAVAPVIPGLTDHEMPAILEAAADAGATSATYVLLRLPLGVSDLFERWLDDHVPDRKAKVLSRVRDLYGGRLYDSRWDVRGRGRGPFATHTRRLFEVTCRSRGLDGERPPLSTEAFRRRVEGQGELDLG